MAGHIEKKGVSVLDQVGIAQKGGAVLSHIRISSHPSEIYSPQISDGTTDLLLGCDMVVSASNEVSKLLNIKKTNSIINDHEAPLSQSVLDPNYSYSGSSTKNLIKSVKHPDIHYLSNFKSAKNTIFNIIEDNSILIIMGAGSIGNFTKQIIEFIK